MPMTETMALALSMPIAWLPVGGSASRAACGAATLRSVWSGPRPSACAASRYPGPTERNPARMISAMFAASCSPSARNPATAGVTRSLTGIA